MRATPTAAALEVLRRWPLKPHRVRRHGDVFKVSAAQGEYVLKPMGKGRKRARFASGLTEHLASRDAELAPALYRTSDGRRLVTEGRRRHWVLCEWIRGRTCDWEHADDVLRCAEALARFHRAARGYVPGPGERPRAYWGGWPANLARRLCWLDEFGPWVERRAAAGLTTGFDQMALGELERQRELGRRALDVLGASAYGDLCRRYRALGQVIHGDPAGRNFVITEYGTVRIIDLETIRLDIPAPDIGKLLRRVLKKHHWDYGLAQRILERYGRILPLEAEMLPVIWVFLAFPAKFYRDLRRYREGRAGWPYSRHRHKLLKHFRQERGKAQFLERFYAEHVAAELRGTRDG